MAIWDNTSDTKEGSITIVQLKDGSRLISDQSGRSFTWPAPSKDPFLNYIDSRIDLTAPVYEQVQNLAAKDKAAAARKTQRKRRPTAP